MSGQYVLGLVQGGIEIPDQAPPFFFEGGVSRVDSTACAPLSVSLCCLFEGSIQMPEHGIEVLDIASEVLVADI